MKHTRKNAVTEDFELLEQGRAYNRQIGLYDTVNRNERFYRGDQWQGVEKGDCRVNAKSLLGVLSLGIVKGMSITLIADGADEAQAIEGLASLIESGFKDL